ncbi:MULTISPECIES: MarR family winged helix-turn-helix transcriptional regulator [unclassified Curtobacterium]|uniref:MarR family winged helix-turn-helix transcriptional regulator n=1 Tax=unclassified Curtobacterium TaxID=257496 RepID=UPI0010E57527|nr:MULTISPECIES: MarR family winged helix-turn-helix transcriptional regulator [unclassified Curtobacterium]TCL77214.1 DNA-binding MarR family transcriptional regulator [Curtobacterium sp. PhB128]TCL92792.1 DNA-binding MarR family transcriptional regulator [Curtobacterium sp. PhB138]
MPSVVSDHVLAEFADVVLRISREIDPHGAGALDIVPLTGTEALVMRWVDRNPGTSPSATAEATALKRSNLSVALRSLVAKGMVERRPDPDDARVVQLHSTDVARESIGRLHAHWAGKLRTALGGDGDGLPEALALLGRLDEGLRRV